MIEIYGWDPEEIVCRPCINAKNLAKTRNLDFVFYPMTRSDDTKMAELTTKVGFAVRTLPQIFVDDAHIGGFDEFKKYANQ